MSILHAITPIVPVRDVLASVKFFQEYLGFTAGYQSSDYAMVKRDRVGVRLVKAAPNVDTHDPARQLSCYIDVEGLDAYYESLQPLLAQLPPGRVRAPFNQAYGQREFHVIDEDSLLIFFGEPIAR